MLLCHARASRDNRGPLISHADASVCLRTAGPFWQPPSTCFTCKPLRETSTYTHWNKETTKRRAIKIVVSARRTERGHRPDTRMHVSYVHRMLPTLISLLSLLMPFQSALRPTRGIILKLFFSSLLTSGERRIFPSTVHTCITRHFWTRSGDQSRAFSLCAVMGCASVWLLILTSAHCSQRLIHAGDPLL